MSPRKRPAKTGSNTAGHFVVKGAPPQGTYKREDFFTDLQKVVKKLPPDHPSRSGSQKH